MGINEGRNRIEYAVDDEEDIREIGEILDELQAPCWLVAAEVRERAVIGGR